MVPLPQLNSPCTVPFPYLILQANRYTWDFLNQTLIFCNLSIFFSLFGPWFYFYFYFFCTIYNLMASHSSSRFSSKNPFSVKTFYIFSNSDFSDTHLLGTVSKLGAHMTQPIQMLSLWAGHWPSPGLTERVGKNPGITPHYFLKI